MHGVEPLGLCLAHPHLLHGNDLKSVLLDLREDLPAMFLRHASGLMMAKVFSTDIAVPPGDDAAEHEV